MAANWRLVPGREALACEEDTAKVADGGINRHFSAATGPTASRSDQIRVQDINAFGVQKPLCRGHTVSSVCCDNFGVLRTRCSAGRLACVLLQHARDQRGRPRFCGALRRAS